MKLLPHALLTFGILAFVSGCSSGQKQAQNPQAQKLQADISELDKPDQGGDKGVALDQQTGTLEGGESTANLAPPEQASAQKPGALQAPNGENDLYNKFNNARAARDINRATEVAGEILTRNPNDVKVLNALAVMAIDEGKFDLARLLLGKVLQKEPTNGAALNNLGVIELKTDNLRLALIQFKKATEADSRNKAAHANLGAIYLQYRNYVNAVAELEAAVENGDQSPATLSNLGFAQAGAGDVNKAQDAYEKAMAKDSSNVPIMLNYAALLVNHNMSKDKATKLLNKIRFVAHEPVILNRVESLLRKLEGGNAKKGAAPSLDKGDLD